MLYPQSQTQNPPALRQSSLEIEENQVEAVNQALATTAKSVRNVKI